MTTKPLRTEPQKRLYSLDALRGFDMFWITGGGWLIVTIAQKFNIGWLEEQFHHVAWEGFHFEDLIFPLFMFIAGVAIPLSVKAKLEKNVPKRKLFRKVFQRMVVLVLLGILYNGTFKNGFNENGRIASVLGQIGIGYFFAALIVIYYQSFRSRIIWLGAVLAGIGIIQLLIPIPGYGSGIITPEVSINGFIDQLLLPGRVLGGTYDPEGILCSLSATGVTLMGTIAGNVLREKKTTDWQKIGYLLAFGAVSILLALALSSFYPIIKKAWTSTFNLLAGGISFILLALFYLIIDHWGFKSWAFYFRVIGMNSIFVYLFTRMVNYTEVSQYFFGWLTQPLGGAQEIAKIVGALIVVWLLLYYMYKKKIFLRV